MKNFIKIFFSTILFFIGIDLFFTYTLPKDWIPDPYAMHFKKIDKLQIDQRYKVDDLYDHDLVKNADVIQNYDENASYRHCTNRYGFKSKCGEKDNSKEFDIAFIGDSFTEAVGMTYEDSFVGLFSEKHADLRIANLGVSSYSPSIYLTKVKFLLDNGIKFKQLFVFVDVSDIQDEGFYYSIVEGKVVNNARKKKIKLYQEYKKSFSYKFERFLKKNFAFSSLIYYNIKKNTKKSLEQVSVCSGKKHIDSCMYDRANWTNTPNATTYGQQGVNAAINKAVSLMKQLKILLDQHDIKLVVGVYPWPYQIRHDIKYNKNVEIWENFCQNNSCYGFINANDYFFNEKEKLGSEKTIHKYYLIGDVHFNKYGNEVIFNEIERQWKK